MIVTGLNDAKLREAVADALARLDVSANGLRVRWKMDQWTNVFVVSAAIEGMGEDYVHVQVTRVFLDEAMEPYHAIGTELARRILHSAHGKNMTTVKTLREMFIEPLLHARRALFVATGIDTSDIEVSIDPGVFDQLVLELGDKAMLSRSKQSLHIHARIVIHRRAV